ncbi:phage baseplate assembly protein V [Variovorax sp. dw_954]|uniref:phage baseplate assembly protein V n=1 Tax=Variovorax sp. dw_954 TaxID=2720078 RepID=UPI001BD4FA6E|nr:phage baseplate assembly protein V [Variovorax sp. dw_954]
MSTNALDPSAGQQRYYGKFRGLVTDNVDPKQMGRIIAQVSAVLGESVSSWCMPCVPAAGMQAGCLIVPPIGSQVWIEFEQGDTNSPIWSGGFWGDGSDVPTLGTAPPAIPPGQNIVLQTTGQSVLVVSDAAPTPTGGGILLRAGGASIVVNATGIYIDNGHGASITLVGNTVAVNETALTVVGGG